MAWADLTPTADETVRIERQEPGYVLYQANDGRRWEVRGVCDRRGYCLIGAGIQTPDGLIEVESLEHLEQLKQELGRERIDSELDVPVGPGFEGCCPLEVTVLGD
jgi:hypothetical protein